VGEHLGLDVVEDAGETDVTGVLRARHKATPG
jgi:hypothetical protein